MQTTTENDSFFTTKHPNWLKFTILWIVVTTVASFAIQYFRIENLPLGWFMRFVEPYDVYFGVILGKLLIGLIIGFAQWVVLWQYVEDAHWWIVGTVIGYALTSIFVLSFISTDIMIWVTDNATFNAFLENLLGEPRYIMSNSISIQQQLASMLAVKFIGVLVISFFQWLLLLRWFVRMGYWVMIALVGELTNIVFMFYVNRLLGWLVLAIITGVGLAWLFKYNWKRETNLQAESLAT